MSNITFDVYTMVNLGILVIYIVFLIRGAKKGFLLQVISALGALLSFVFAWRYAPIGMKYYNLFPSSWNPLKDTIFATQAYEWMNRMAWFFLLFIVFKLFFLILEKLADGLQSIPVLKQVSGLLGALLGGISATIWILIACLVLNQPMISMGKDIIENTALKPISQKTTEVFTFLKEPLTDTEKFNELLNDIQSTDDSDTQAIEELLHQIGLETLEERGEE